MRIFVEFGGGAELLFGGVKKQEIDLPAKENCYWTIGTLLQWLKENLLKERPELFLQEQSVRPGILVLVNDTDWELMDCANYALQSNDRITFISTLHGG